MPSHIHSCRQTCSDTCLTEPSVAVSVTPYRGGTWFPGLAVVQAVSTTSDQVSVGRASPERSHNCSDSSESCLQCSSGCERPCLRAAIGPSAIDPPRLSHSTSSEAVRLLVPILAKSTLSREIQHLHLPADKWREDSWLCRVLATFRRQCQESNLQKNGRTRST